MVFTFIGLQCYYWYVVFVILVVYVVYVYMYMLSNSYMKCLTCIGDNPEVHFVSHPRYSTMGEQWVEHRSIGELHRTDLNMKKKEKRKRSSKEQEAGKKAILVSV